MRKFIISDIHGNGNIYNSIMGYLDNIRETDEIELYINGDLIDKGIESADILIDVIKRIDENKFKIIYLGGNHELLMHDIFEKRKKGINTFYNEWHSCGGQKTDYGLEERLRRNDILKVAEFVSNLKIYHIFNEKINGKKILLVHAAAPSHIEDNCYLSIKDNNEEVYRSVWTRNHNDNITVGNKDYFTIVGHTPNYNVLGYEYHPVGNYLNIDGGNSYYVCGHFNHDHVPLIEVEDEKLKILTFTNGNKIIAGNYFIKDKSCPMKESELKKEVKNINSNVKIKKLIRFENGIIGYLKGNK